MGNISAQPHDEGIRLVLFGKEYKLTLEAAQDVSKALFQPRGDSGSVRLDGELVVLGPDTRLSVAVALRDVLGRPHNARP